MAHHMSPHLPCLIQLRLVICTLVALGTVLLASCQETTLPSQPPLNPNPEQCKPWPAPYYCLVETGVSSRVLGLRSPGQSLAEARSEVERLLGKFEEQWDTIRPLETPEELVIYFRQHDLLPLAGAIEQTLAHTQEPPGGVQHSQLQAMAIKEGLIYAYRQVKGAWPR